MVYLEFFNNSGMLISSILPWDVSTVEMSILFLSLRLTISLSNKFKESPSVGINILSIFSSPRIKSKLGLMVSHKFYQSK